MNKCFVMVLMSGLALISACSALELERAPTADYQLGEIVFEDDFTDGSNWDIRSVEGATLRVQNGRYNIESIYSSYVRGFNNQMHENVVIEVEIAYRMAETNNAFGVICRGTLSDYNSGGYYFLIGADGTYSIRVGRAGEVDSLVPWTRSSAINGGTANNDIRVVCIDDYLALYVNDVLVADVRDGRFTQGFAGLTVATVQGTPIEVIFDNMTIWDAELVGDDQ